MNKIYYFSAAWCGPCKMMAPLVDTLQGELNIEKVDVDNDTDLILKYGIKNVPTFIKVDSDGAIIAKKIGAQTEASLRELSNA